MEKMLNLKLKNGNIFLYQTTGTFLMTNMFRNVAPQGRTGGICKKNGHKIK